MYSALSYHFAEQLENDVPCDLETFVRKVVTHLETAA